MIGPLPYVLFAMYILVRAQTNAENVTPTQKAIAGVCDCCVIALGIYTVLATFGLI